MIQFFKQILLLFPFALMATGQFTQKNNLKIWHETFGSKEKPAILLVMGALCQGILWPTEFCQQLADRGFFVIRYDHRDTGLSSNFDFTKHPYDLQVLAQDAIDLLNHLKIKKAHLVGLSMGGPVVEIASVKYPERVASITLIATSIDFRPSSLSYDKAKLPDTTLSKPKQIYLDWMHKFLASPPTTSEEDLEQRVACWRILNGNVAPFEEQLYHEIHKDFLARNKHPESMLNHLEAIKNSFELIQKIPFQVKVPTLILHGTEDPIFPPDHGQALAKAIPHAKFLLVPGLGHVPNKRFYDLFIKEIQQIFHRNNND